MNNLELRTHILDTVAELNETLEQYTVENFNNRPAAGGWTAGQACEHILLSAQNIVHVLNGPVAMSFRNADEKVEAIKSLFLDYSTKLNAPDFIIPTDGPHSKSDLKSRLNDVLDTVLTAINTLPLSDTCLAFQLPGFGSLTRMEWIAFILYHSQRHIHQLQQIRHRIIEMAS